MSSRLQPNVFPIQKTKQNGNVIFQKTVVELRCEGKKFRQVK